MAMKTTFVMQTFKIHRKRLVTGDREVAPTESGALKKAEAMAARMPGTAALKVVADDETGELEGATILGQWGETRHAAHDSPGRIVANTAGSSSASRIV